MTNILANSPPGLSVVINSTDAGGAIAGQPTSNAFLGGYSGWGPVGRPQWAFSFADAQRMYGGLNTNSVLMDALYSYFNHYRGAGACISRAVGPTPVLATKTLKDRASGTPLDTVRVDALYASSSVDISVEVAAGTTSGVKYIFRSVALNIVEPFDNVTLSAADITSVNNRSQLVKLTNLASATASPNNLPAILAATPLVGGDDDFGNITATNYANSLTAFQDFTLGTGQVAVPGQSNATVLAALKTQAENYQRLGVGDSPFGNSVSAMLALDTSSWRSTYMWYMYAWEQAARFDAGDGLKYYPPSIAGLGACAKVDRERGPERSPANFGTVPYALDVERNTDGSPLFSDASRLSLDNKQICPVVPLGGQGIKIYGDRLHYPAGETLVRGVNERRMLNMIYYSVALGLAWAPFESANDRTFRQIASVTTAYMDDLWRNGSLFGDTAKEAYSVVCDRSNNSDAQLEAFGITVNVAAKLTKSAPKVGVAIRPVPLTQDMSLINGGGN